MIQLHEKAKGSGKIDRTIRINALEAPVDINSTSGSFNFQKSGKTNLFKLTDLLKHKAFAVFAENTDAVFGLIEIDKEGNRKISAIDKTGIRIDFTFDDTELQEAVNRLSSNIKSAKYIALRDAAGKIRIIDAVANDLDVQDDNDPTLQEYSKRLQELTKEYIKIRDDDSVEGKRLADSNTSSLEKALNTDPGIKSVFIKTAPIEGGKVHVEYAFNHV